MGQLNNALPQPLFGFRWVESAKQTMGFPEQMKEHCAPTCLKIGKYSFVSMHDFILASNSFYSIHKVFIFAGHRRRLKKSYIKHPCSRPFILLLSNSNGNSIQSQCLLMLYSNMLYSIRRRGYFVGLHWL